MNSFFKECTKMALHTFISNKLRSALSILGVMIGVSSIVVIMSLGRSVSKNMISTFSEGGINIITIRPRNRRATNEIFNDAFASELKNNFESIEECIVTNSESCNIRYISNNTQALVIGTYSVIDKFYSLKLNSGEIWNIEDNINSKKVCLIGSEVAKNLFNGEDPVGCVVKIYHRNTSSAYTVCAVLEETDATASIDFNNSVFVPFNTFSSKIKRSNNVGSYIIKIKDDYNPSKESENIKKYLESLVSDEGFDLFSLSTIRDMISQTMGTLTLFIALIGAISLFVGGIGIMNIMIVSVRERTKEIGIMKAIGAQPKFIEYQFLVEAVFLTLIGGIVGILLGIIISLISAFSLNWPLSISFLSIISSLGFSLLVGIFFGVYPARIASRLNAIEALSRE